MLEETFHCDGPQCKKTTQKDRPDFGWVMVRALSDEYGDGPTMLDDGARRERHYCSPTCEHAHSYLLISGDNGK